MQNCAQCNGSAIRSTRLETHNYALGGLRVELISSAFELVCADCGESAILIPNLSGLTAAVAIARVQEAVKLNGREIRFLRKSLGMTARVLGDKIGIAPETVSRWEADKLVVSPQNEMLLRLLVAGIMTERAPAMDVSIEAILGLKVTPFRNGFDDEPMRFETVRLKELGRKKPHWDTLELAA